MRRDDLLQSLTYDPLPRVVSCRKDLTAAAKLVYGVLLGYMRRHELEVCISANALADMTGTSRNTVLRALADLQAAGLIQDVSHGGQQGRYVFQPLATQPKMGPDPTQNGTGDDGATQPILVLHPTQNGTGPNPKWDRTQPKMGPVTNQQDKTTTAAAADAVVLALLKEAGVGQPVLGKLAKDKTVTAARIRRLLPKASTAKNPAGQLVSLLMHGDTGLPKGLTPRQAAGLINDGLIERIHGQTLEPGARAKYNDTTLVITTDGVSVELDASEINGALE